MDLSDVTIGNAQLLRVDMTEYLKDENGRATHLIVGDNGIGKTRLLAAIKDTFREDQESAYAHIHADSFDIEELMMMWVNTSKKSPHVRGQILNILSKIQRDFVDIECIENIITDDKELMVELSGCSERVNILNMGQGFRRAFEITLKAWVAEQAVVLIDDIELGLHHSIHEAIWAYLYKVAEVRGNQLFATTHSMDMINGFIAAPIAKENSGNVEPDKLGGLLLRLEHTNKKIDDGCLNAVIICKKSVSRLAAGGIDVRSTPRAIE